MAAPAPPSHVRIRSYNVGFGDCFLLTFTYGKRSRNVLIDFGSTQASRSGPKGGMLAIAEKIRDDCGGKLQMLVATHRHADHISGFAGKPGKVIESLEPDLVVQPWTEDPTLDPEASAPATSGSDANAARAKGMVARLSAMQAVADAALAQLPRLEAAKGVHQTVTKQLRFLGETNIRNAESVKNLMTMGQERRYAHFRSKLPIARLLPGVRIDVLGPPTLKQSSQILRQAETDENEFWHLAARVVDGVGENGSEPFPAAATADGLPQEARWLIPRIDKLRGEEVLAIVRMLDGVLNNTSLILLFEVGDSRLLFPGDAQLENWSYALRDNKDAKAIAKRLASARFYKVGHHGSLNATPKTLWNGFDRRSDDKEDKGRLATMVSTTRGKHGAATRGTEVPRKPLIEELDRLSNLRNTQSLTRSGEFWIDVDLDL